MSVFSTLQERGFVQQYTAGAPRSSTARPLPSTAGSTRPPTHSTSGTSSRRELDLLAEVQIVG